MKGLNRKEVKELVKAVQDKNKIDGSDSSRTLKSIRKSREILLTLGEEGNKFDDQKLRYDLLPIDAIEEITKVYTMGSVKYGDRNWEKGMSWGRLFAALLRHLFAFWLGEDYDKESGLLHTAHASWNAIALLTYQKRKIGTDDRQCLENEIVTK